MTGQVCVGVVGTGNMGSALVRGWLRAPRSGVRLIVWDRIDEAARRLAEPGLVEQAGSLGDLVGRADVVLVVVKPKDAREVLESLRGLLRDGQVVVSSMAGITLDWMRGILGPGPSLYRIMPNLGVELGVGAIALACEPACPAAEAKATMELFAPLGLVEILPEAAFDAVTGVSGSGPAFLALAIEGMEDGAVAAGLSRAVARRLVRETAVATAKLLASCGDSPAELRKRLAAGGRSHAGAAETSESLGIRTAFAEAVEAAVSRSGQLR